MKTLLILLCVCLLISSTATPQDRVERFVESKQPMIIDGNWLQPENGGYFLVATDEYLTVNGYEYVHPEDETLSKYVPPDKDAGFLDWINRTTKSKAQDIINEGGSKEEAWEYMDQRFSDHVEEGVFWYEIDDYGVFKLYHKDFPFPLSVAAPSHIRRDDDRLTYRQSVITPQFDRLMHYLETGYFVMRGTRNATIWAFSNKESELVQRDLKQFVNSAVTSSENGEQSNRTVIVGGIYKLTPSDIRLLTNPADLVRR